MIGTGLSSSEFACNWEKGPIHVFVKRWWEWTGVCWNSASGEGPFVHLSSVNDGLCDCCAGQAHQGYQHAFLIFLDWTHVFFSGFSIGSQPLRTNGAAMLTALTAAMSWRPPQQSLRRRPWRAVASDRPCVLARGWEGGRWFNTLWSNAGKISSHSYILPKLQSNWYVIRSGWGVEWYSFKHQWQLHME